MDWNIRTNNSSGILGTGLQTQLNKKQDRDKDKVHIMCLEYIVKSRPNDNKDTVPSMIILTLKQDLEKK